MKEKIEELIREEEINLEYEEVGTKQHAYIAGKITAYQNVLQLIIKEQG